jgi:gliding motility-associated-like protein
MYLYRSVLLASFLVALDAWAQTPSKCLEIESILVDACNPSDICPGSTEGQNEMVRFRTGPQATALGDLEADWPNNSWQGLVQNATTAQVTAELNATIESCGWLLEPPGGVIPPGSPVLMVTSTAMCTAANSFASLGDTLYIIFQAPGNSAGHFANHNNGNTGSPTPSGGESLRTLVLTYLPTACSDSATYDRQLLVNINGTYGGNSALNDGATAEFTWPGVPSVTYINNGCQAPVIPVSVDIEVLSGSLCDGGTITLGSVLQGDITSLQWSGGTGTFSDPTGDQTTYTPGPGDIGDVVLQLCGEGNCADPVCTTITLPTGNAPVVTITADGPLALCPGENVELTASGAASYLWSTQATGATIVVDQPGTYSVVGTGACGSASANVEVTAATGPAVTITGDDQLCAGSSSVLTASGADSYVWSTQETGAFITVNAGGTYTVTGTTSCGSGTATILVEELQTPVAAISGDLAICPGESTTLTATGGPDYLWSTSEQTAAIQVAQPGTYTVTVTNACGTSTASVEVTNVLVSAAITASPSSGVAPLEVSFMGQSSTVDAALTWDLGDGGSDTGTDVEHLYLEPGVYTVTLTATAAGCTATATTTITVLDGPSVISSITVPNVFTPDGDGQNDELTLEEVGIAAVDLEVLNRWGQVVGRIERPGQVWDARSFSGEQVPEGTYFFVMTATGADGRKHESKGTITVLR